MEFQVVELLESNTLNVHIQPFCGWEDSLTIRDEAMSGDIPNLAKIMYNEWDPKENANKMTMYNFQAWIVTMFLIKKYCVYSSINFENNQQFVGIKFCIIEVEVIDRWISEWLI